MEDLIIGKYYNLTLSDYLADNQEYLDGLKKYSGLAKLIGVGQINCLDYEYIYTLFRNIETDEIIEVSNNHTLVFFDDNFKLGHLSTNARIGEKFPVFGGPNIDCYPHVAIEESDEN